MRSLLRNLYYKFAKFLYRTHWLLPSFHTDKSTTTVHFLVVKKRDYASLVQIAIESLLFHNPGFKVRVHCDDSTYPALTHKLFLTRIRHRGKVSLSIDSNDDHWKTLKYNLLLSLKGTNEFFLDADTKVNAKLKLFDSPFFLVSEYRADLSAFKNLPPEVLNSRLSSFLVKNTSAFGWGGINLTTNQIEVAWKIYESVSVNLENSEKARLSEQIALSLFLDWLDVSTKFLKEKDAQFDQGIVESSYFGATTSRFF
jgi:hypothetical protein